MSYNDRQLKKLFKIADKVLSFEKEMTSLSNEELREKTLLFKQRLLQGTSLDELLPEAFAVCREAAWRILGMKPYYVQIVGGIVLHQGRIAEMKTGEGKTLVATMPAYLNGLAGRGVHIVTVNDYLAKRDSEQMGKIFRFLGLTVGLITGDIPQEKRAEMYAADITYGTNNEFGFDYLRDNMAKRTQDRVQRKHSFAIIDEVDSILIDEARTPLIISGKGNTNAGIYQAADHLAKSFVAKKVKEFDKTIEHEDEDADYLIDEKGKNVVLTTRGISKAEKAFGLSNFADPQNMQLVHYIMQAVRANGTMKRDVDYIVHDGEIIIVDEFTGRLMYGRRYNDGLHQAIEAKEGVEVAGESKTFATVTFQNFFRLYDKISGMTGTAKTEEEEFRCIYKLDVVVIPTNKPVIRKDHQDQVYGTEEAKEKAILTQVQKCFAKKQPILIGTVSVEKSEHLSKLLKKANIPHNVLNAKNHEREAEIIAQAGRPCAVTIATNMAGRGTDIVLGGNPDYLAAKKLLNEGVSENILSLATSYAEIRNAEIRKIRKQYLSYRMEYAWQTTADADLVRKAGGLFILGTERHESRRVDNQLRGRAGRQGDPGESQFFLSLDDSLLRLFIPNGVLKNIIDAGLDGDEPIKSKMLTNAIESAQKRLEGRNFDIRKNVLQYDDVLNQQRLSIYGTRNEILDKNSLRPMIISWAYDIAEMFYNKSCHGKKQLDDKDFAQFALNIEKIFGVSLAEINPLPLSLLLKKKKKEMLQSVFSIIDKRYANVENEIGIETMRQLEKTVLLYTIDYYWMEHIDQMAKAKEGIALQAYGQNDPVIEYKVQAFDMYELMQKQIKVNTIYRLFNAKKEAENVKE